MTWQRDVFIKEVESVKKPLALFVDGHASHTALIETSDLCLKNNIVLYCLKSHASHIIQPIDLAFTGAVKVHWERQVRRHMQETGEAVSLRTFAQVLKPAWEAAAVPENGFKGFSSSGIHPFNPERALQSEKLCPSLNFIAAGPPPTSAAPPPDNVLGTSLKSQPQQTAIEDLIYVLHEVRKLPEETFEMMMGTCKKEGFVEPEKGKFKLLCTPLPAVTPQVETTEDYDHLADVLKLPAFTKSTTKKSATAASMSMALTGDAYRSYLKKLDKEKALEAKEQRKIARENKKRKAQEKEEKQKTREEAKKRKVEEKERKAQEQARKKMEREEAKRRHKDSTDSNEDEEELGIIYNDDSASDYESENDDLCKRCHTESEGL